MKRLVKWMSARRPHSPARKPGHKPRLRVEPLDDRLVPSTLFVDATGVLTYTAGAGVANHLAVSLDPATDTYRFSDAEVINAPGFLGNGTTAVSVPNAAVSSMKVLLGDAADALTVESTQDPIQVQAGAGDDQITLVSTGGTLDGIQGRISVAGEDGSDTLTVNDQGAAAGKTYVLTASTLARAGVTLVNSYGTLENVSLNATGLTDSIVVRSTAPGTAVTVNAGAGNDVLFVAGLAGGLDGIQGHLELNGQDGKDAVTVDDSGSSAGRSFTVTSAGVAGSGSAGIDYFTAESVVVRAGAFDDVFAVQSTLAGTPVTLNTGDGNDAVYVGGAFVGSPLDSIQGVLTVNGQGGADGLTIDDFLSPVGRTYTVASGSVSRPGAALIKYGTVEGVAVGATNYNDQFFVQSTAAGTAVNLYEGFGDDSVNVGSNASDPSNSTLDLVQGTLTADGGGGFDSITLNDQASRSGQTFTVTYASMSRSGMAQINYSFQDLLLINAGTFNDVVNMVSTAAGTPVTVFLGKGDDTVNVGEPDSVLGGSSLGAIQGTLRVYGGDGKDVLNLNDQENDGLFNLPGRTYLVYPNGVQRSGAAEIDFLDFLAEDSVVLNATTGDDTINVAFVSSGPSLAVNAGDGVDAIRIVEDFSDPYPLPGRQVTVNGQGGIDTLDYSFVSVDGDIGVRVNLAQGTATGLTGLSGVENVTGGAGDDVLIGDAGSNVLRGGIGRDLLIGGAGADRLYGDYDEDILIGNATTLDSDPAALEAIMGEWGLRGLAQPYDKRIQQLKLGVGTNGAVKLDLTKLIEDGAQDILTGGGDSQDWFFLTGADFAPDLNYPALEQVN